jgi:hypothetical protein
MCPKSLATSVRFFKIVKIYRYSTGYKQVELIDESLFSAPRAEQETWTISWVVPEAETKNYKEGDTVKVTVRQAGSRRAP